MASMAGLRCSSHVALDGSLKLSGSNRLLSTCCISSRIWLARSSAGFSTVRAHQESNENDQTSHRKMLGLAATGLASGTFVLAVLADAAAKTSGGLLRLGGRSSNFVVGTSETEAKTEGEEEEKKEAEEEEEKYQEYEVVLTQPYGIKFTKGGDGGTYIDAIAPEGSADKSGVIAVGDKVLATSAVFGDEIWPAAEYGRTMYTIRQRIGPLLMRMEKRYGKLPDMGELTEKEIIRAERNAGFISNRVREIQLANSIRKREQKERREKDLREGLQLYKTGQFEQALEKFESVLGSRPESNEASIASYNVACCYSKLDQWLCGCEKVEESFKDLNDGENDIHMFDSDEKSKTQIPTQAQSLVEGSSAVVVSANKPIPDVDYLQELLAIQQQGPRSIGFFGTRNMGFMHQELIEILSYALVITKNHIFTSGASGTNAAVIRGALRAEKPELLTVILPQSLKKQSPESQELLAKVQNVIEKPYNDHLPLIEASRLCNMDIISHVQQVICFAFHDSRLLMNTCQEAKNLRKIVTLFYLD